MITCKNNAPTEDEVRWNNLLENLGRCPDKVVRTLASPGQVTVETAEATVPENAAATHGFLPRLVGAPATRKN